MTKPVLSAIHALLQFRDSTTIGEIARMCGKPQRHVLDVINTNGKLVERDRKTGRITKADPRGVLRAQLWNSGEFYVPHDLTDDENPARKRGGYLEFMGRDELRARLETTVVQTYGKSKMVLDTPENRAALAKAGMERWDEIAIDDRLWKEDA